MACSGEGVPNRHDIERQTHTALLFSAGDNGNHGPHYEDDVDHVTARIKQACEIDHVNSDDKRGALEPQEFGYRSVHLVARVRRSIGLTPEYAAIRRKWFEIQ